jgi:hypothetical protein
LHILILIKVIPYHLIWGGRLKTDKEMYRFEIVSILINALFVIIILVQAKIFAIDILEKVMTYALWLMTGLFVLNTWGNAISKNKLEKRLFTPVTIIMTIFSLILALAS